MSNKIQIAVACGFNSEKYVEFLIDTIDRTVSNENEIEYIIGISNEKVDKDYINNIKTKYVMKIIDIFKDHGNSGHGLTLNELLKHLNSEYGMFVDCDIGLLIKNWDIKMQKQLIDNKIIIGSEYEGKKYWNFPNATFCMFKTDILKGLNISFIPLSRNHKHLFELDEEKAKYFCRNVGDRIVLDVGWELPIKIKKNNYDGVYLTSHARGKFVNNGLVATEYQLDGEVIATHIARSSVRDFVNDPKVIMWKQRVIEWIEKL